MNLEQLLDRFKTASHSYECAENLLVAHVKHLLEIEDLECYYNIGIDDDTEQPIIEIWDVGDEIDEAIGECFSPEHSKYHHSAFEIRKLQDEKSLKRYRAILSKRRDRESTIDSIDDLQCKKRVLKNQIEKIDEEIKELNARLSTDN